jgi:hypothetical protein
MYLSAYHFDGEPTRLAAAYDRFVAGIPAEQLDVHLCVVREDGLTILDSCPSEEDFVAFSRDPGFRAALTAAGLPEPRVEPLGEVRVARIGQPVP